jgi:hypothetical protein
MGQRPTQRNESQDATPAKAGVHVREELDSRSPAFAEDKLRGNDVTFDAAQRGISLRCLRVMRRTKGRFLAAPSKVKARAGGTPSPGPPRLVKTPAAVHPLPQGLNTSHIFCWTRGVSVR